MKTKDGNRKVVNEALILTVSAIIVKLLGLVFKVPLSYILTDEGMGYFNTAYTVYTFFYIICTAGVPKAISVLIAEKSGAGREEDGEKLFTSAFYFFSLLGIAASLLLALFSGLFSHLIGSDKSQLTMITIAPSLLFVSAAGALRGYFNGKLKLLPIAVSEVISGVAKLVLGLLFAHYAFDRGMANYQISAFAILGITIGSFLGFIYLYFLNLKEHQKGYRGKFISFAISKSNLAEILKIAVPLTLTAGVGSFLNLIDVGLVMHSLHTAGFSELQANVLYGNYTTLVIPMFNLTSTLLTPVSMLLLPMLTKDSRAGNNVAFNQKYKLAYNVVVLFALPISLLFLFYSSDILKIIFENASASMAAPLLSLLSPAVFFMSLLFVLNTAIEGMGDFKIPVISLSLGSVIKIIISCILIKNDNFNMMAAPLGTLVSYIMGIIISLAYLSLKTNMKFIYISPLLTSLISFFTAKKLSERLLGFSKISFAEDLNTLIFLTLLGILYLICLAITFFINKISKKYIHIRQKKTL